MDYFLNNSQYFPVYSSFPGFLEIYLAEKLEGSFFSILPGFSRIFLNCEMKMTDWNNTIYNNKQATSQAVNFKQANLLLTA
jgi:hypothetical protein